jgi:hypothetical protein
VLWVSGGRPWDGARSAEEVKRGAPRTFSNTAIPCMARLSAVYRLALRVTEGLLASVLKLLNVQLPVPDYTTLCQRRRRCTPVTTSTRSTLEALVIALGIQLSPIYASSVQFNWGAVQAHTRRHYDEHEALHVLEHVRLCMGKLSLRINEDTEEPIQWDFK